MYGIYESILAFFQRFEPFFEARIWIRIRIRVKSRIRIRINVMRIHNTGKMYRTIYLHDVSLSTQFITELQRLRPRRLHPHLAAALPLSPLPLRHFRRRGASPRRYRGNG
jgi:hypothetical protein